MEKSKSTDTNIHTAIAAVMAEVGYVKKESSPNLAYTYAGERALIQVLRPEMVKQKIYAAVVKVEDVTRERYTTRKGAEMVSTRLTATVRYTHASSETFVDVQAIGEGSDAGDKSCGKAMTGAVKYTLRETFLLETGDDPDKNSSSEQERGEPFEKHAKKPDSLQSGTFVEAASQPYTTAGTELDQHPADSEAEPVTIGSTRFGTCRHCGSAMMKETSHSKANPDREYWKCVNEECHAAQSEAGRKDGGFRGWCDETPTGGE